MYCVLNMGWTPSQYIKLSPKDKAFVIASILTKLDEEKKQSAKIKAQQSKYNSRARRR